MTSKEIRNQFIQFFRDKDHKFVRSAGVVPFDDPTLLFTNAGMNQFKGIFLGNENVDHPRAVNSQKCIRVSGKHNDLEEVGKDTYHHTFFEMLGNWSFGDYYKAEAITWAWELFTDVWKIPKDKLYATVYQDDDEAFDLWKSQTDIMPEHILRFGAKDNFWEMGETGPCGPCSELHVDIGGDSVIAGSDPDRGVNTDNPRFMELWNLVFIQYNRDEEGELSELPHKHVDTGAGFERIVAYLQGKDSNYETDLFIPILEKIADISGVAYKRDDRGMPHRVIADHLRMLTFSITDGALPANDGRGYVLRRILRRAARFGRNLGMTKPFISELVPTLVEVMGEAFPEIAERCDYVQRVIRAEEESFSVTLDRGIQIFNGLASELQGSGKNTIPGEDVFKLYDTYGFPVDLTRLMAEEQELAIDEEGFEQQMDAQREQARSQHRFKQSGSGENEWIVLREGKDSTFLGYTHAQADAHILRYRSEEDGYVVVLDRTPFYAESGGQVGDTGLLLGPEFRAVVTDTQKEGDSYLHFVKVEQGELSGEPLMAEVDESRRNAIRRNHSATHLLNAALRNVLGDHVKQSGSLVNDVHLRFDFNHFEKVTAQDLREIERQVNHQIRQNNTTLVLRLDFDHAREEGALAFFGEKYGDEVRTVKFGDYSHELCGGIHVHASGDIGYFRIQSESSIASGVRRIEAITGRAAEEQAREEREIVDQLRNLLKMDSADLVQKIDDAFQERRRLEKELKQQKLQSTTSNLDNILDKSVDIEGISVLIDSISVSNMEELKQVADELVLKIGSGVGVLGTVIEEAPYVVCTVTEDVIAGKKLKAGDIVRELGARLGGGGGGKPHMATAGGKDAEKLEEVLAEVPEIIRGMLA